MLEDILTTVTVLIRSVSTFNASYLKHFVCCMVVSQYFIDNRQNIKENWHTYLKGPDTHAHTLSYFEVSLIVLS